MKTLLHRLGLAAASAAAAMTLQAASVQAAPASAAKPLRLVIISTDAFGQDPWHFDATIAIIRSAISPRPLAVRECSTDDFYSPYFLNTYDMAIAPGGTLAYHLRTSGGSLLAATRRPGEQQQAEIGSAIFVRMGTRGVHSLADLADRTLAITSRHSFFGYMVPMQEISHAAGGATGQLSQPIELGGSFTGVVNAVLKGRADVGFVPICLIESLVRSGQIGEGAVRILNAQQSPSGCRRSTRLYPGWSLGARRTVDTETQEKILSALLGWKDPKSPYQWTVPANLEQVFRMFSLLDRTYEPQDGFLPLLERYWMLPAGIALVLLLLLAYTAVLRHAVNLRTESLKDAYEARLEAEQKSRNLITRMESMQRSASIGNLSSMVAHELKQPLAVIANYTQGLEAILKSGTLTPDMIKMINGEISEACAKASGIIDNVRNYAKGIASPHERLRFDRIVSAAIVQVRKAATGSAVPDIDSDLQEGLVVDGSRIELEILVHNIIKNACEAVSGLKDGRVFVMLKADSETVTLAVRDNGKPLTDEDFARLQIPGKSSKPNGLGLGLAIVRQLVESHAGSMAHRRLEGRGIECTVRLPRAQPEPQWVGTDTEVR